MKVLVLHRAATLEELVNEVASFLQRIGPGAHAWRAIAARCATTPYPFTATLDAARELGITITTFPALTGFDEQRKITEAEAEAHLDELERELDGPPPKRA